MKTISILVPCYNEEAGLEIFYQAVSNITDNMPKYTFDFLFIDDGSSDQTLDIIKRLQEKNNNIFYISLSRNFGKEIAMLAGMDHVNSDACIIMDADLQDSPSLIPKMIAEWENGYFDVYAKRQHRNGETWFKKFSSKIYYRILNKLSDVPVLVDVGDFRLLDRQCIKALRSMRECQRYTKGLFSWIGYKKKSILYDRQPRKAGKTKWNYRKLIHLAIDGITSFSTVPLHVSSWLGFLVSFCAFFYMLFIILKTLIYGDSVPGYPSLVAIILFVGGIQLIVLGIIGEYLGKIFNESKNRPVYLVAESNITKPTHLNKDEFTM